MSATYWIDGVPLDDPDGRWMLRDGTAFGVGSSRSSSLISVPGMDGARRGRSSRQSASLPLELDVFGMSDGDLERNRTALEALLSAEAMTVTRLVDGVESTAEAAGGSTSKPTYFTGAYLLRFTATLTLPLAVWRGRAAPWTGTGQVTTLDGSTAPIDDALLLIDGPAANPVISCGDAWAKLTLDLDDGESALVDCDKWTVRAGEGVTFAGGGDLRTGVLTVSSLPYLLRLEPTMLGSDPTLRTVTVACTDGDLSVLAAPAWLA